MVELFLAGASTDFGYRPRVSGGGPSVHNLVVHSSTLWTIGEPIPKLHTDYFGVIAATDAALGLAQFFYINFKRLVLH